MKIWFAAAVAAFSLIAVPAPAQSSADVTAALTTNFGDAEPFVAAIGGIKAAVAAGDATAFAGWVSYPFRVTVDGEDYVFEDEDGVIDHYESMMTDEIVRVILNQQYQDLFVNAEGVMFGDGQLWLNGICTTDSCEEFDVKIITVQSTAN